jgi:hypothetical protein
MMEMAIFARDRGEFKCAAWYMAGHGIRLISVYGRAPAPQEGLLPESKHSQPSLQPVPV